jgi:hypothetical protein
MIITNKSDKYDIQSTNILSDLLLHLNYDLEKYVSDLIICDEENIEDEIREFDPSCTITKENGCVVKGKTILHNNKSILFISSEIILDFFNNFVIEEAKDFKFSDNSLIALKTILHEIGHAKRYFSHGKLNIRKAYDSYEAMLNGYWQIVRDEYFAEMNCANIIKLKQSIDWYGDFSDTLELSNFNSYVEQYMKQYSDFNSHIAMKSIHNYYLIPLFYKSGFYEGASKFININHINVCSRIRDIHNCDVINSEYVPKEYNDIILNLWEIFGIEENIKSNN